MDFDEKIKILILTDIHSDYDAARIACESNNPDLVLDCGDHTDLVNVSGLISHYFVHGNHEPDKIILDSRGYPLPNKISGDQIYHFKRGKLKIRFSGIGGNYSSRAEEKHVNEKDLINLRSMPTGLEVLLFHESPFNISEESNQFPLAQRVIGEIKRIHPIFVFSGHTGIYSESIVDEKTRVINLMDAGKGYAVLELTDAGYIFNKIISRFR